VRVIPKGDRTTISHISLDSAATFHQEHLPGAGEREERRAHFTAALDALEALIRAE
jgi:hypothetical protein